MDEFIEKIYSDYPDAIISSPEMKEPNETILIFDGPFILKQGETEIKITGKIEFTWQPRLGVQFNGTAILDSPDAVKAYRNSEKFELIIDGLFFGDCYLTSTSLSNLDDKTGLGGIVIDKTVKDDRTINVSSIRFSIPNLIDFHGLPIKWITATGVKSTMGRIVFENNDYIITIDKSDKYKERHELLRLKGGFLTLYFGEVKSKKGSISYSDIQETIYNFSTFLSFLNGRRTSLLFIHGMHDNEIIWSDYGGYDIDTFKEVITWPRKLSIDGLNDIWIKFSDLWKDKEDQYFLTAAVHWYIEANSGSGYAEGSIIMAQTALELVYNWLLIEKRKLLIGKDAENISAANKIRLLLSHINVSTDIPNSLKHLQSYRTDNSDTITDGPEAVVQIRNAIVHSQQEKRKKLSMISPGAKAQALRLCIWYIELSLLYILDYKGKYQNRCPEIVSPLNAEQLVPWIKD